MKPTTPAASMPEYALPNSHAAFARANRVIPGGVNSPARAFGALQSRLKFPPPIIVAVVSGDFFDCFVLKTPSENWPFWVLVPPALAAIVMLEIPFEASRIEPTGMLSSLPSSRNCV